MTHDTDLDRLLAEAGTQAPAPSDALMSRVMADALAHLPKAPVAAPMIAPPAPPRRSLWALLAAGLGGGGVLAGLGAVAALGLVVGYVNPAGLGALADDFLSTSGSGLELMPASEIFLSEG